MKRREFIEAIGASAIAWPLAACPDAAFGQTAPMRRIGALLNLPETDPEGNARIAAFRDALDKLGWTEGRNVAIEYRSYSGDPKRAVAYAAELIAMQPDVILAAPASALAVVQRQTSTVPVVFAQVGDPVGSGFVASLARPGGNITGFSATEFSLGTKWLELLKEIAPTVTRVGVIYDPANPVSAGYLSVIDAAARSSGLQATMTAVHDDAEIVRAIEAIAREPTGGLIVVAGPLTVVHRDLIVSLAARHRLPAVYPYRFFPVSGGLASYGIDDVELYRRAASYVDRILRGEKPADLPVQEPNKFELVINLKTAKALGLNVPAQLLATADKVIE